MECWSDGVMLKLEYKKSNFLETHHSITPILHYSIERLRPLDCSHFLEALDLPFRITYCSENLNCMFTISRRGGLKLESKL